MLMLAKFMAQQCECSLSPKRAKKQNADDFIICVETVNPVVQERINPARG